jgi:DNA-binding NarL/FixJ family response regulator
MINSETRRGIILVVDDSPETLRFLTDALSGAGMMVMVAQDGVSTMRVVENLVPDMILLDAVMPGMDGFEVCQTLKRDSRLIDVPVIFMTGLKDTEHIVRGLKAGGVDYLTKPIVIEELLARIHVHIANARLTQSARAALDVSGRFLFAVNIQGSIVWATPQAQKLLASHQRSDTPSTLVLPESWLAWLIKTQNGLSDPKEPFSSPSLEADQMQLQYVAKLGADEFLLGLAKNAGQVKQVDFTREFGLTAREVEVLAWLSEGKSNRDIAQILGLSPRTIDKHLQQTFAKLGVENRTAAAAIAVKARKPDFSK